MQAFKLCSVLFLSVPVSCLFPVSSQSPSISVTTIIFTIFQYYYHQYYCIIIVITTIIIIIITIIFSAIIVVIQFVHICLQGPEQNHGSEALEECLLNKLTRPFSECAVPQSAVLWISCKLLLPEILKSCSLVSFLITPRAPTTMNYHFSHLPDEGYFCLQILQFGQCH